LAHVGKSLGVWSKSESSLVRRSLSDGTSGLLEHMFAFGMPTPPASQFIPWVGVQQPRNRTWCLATWSESPTDAGERFGLSYGITAYRNASRCASTANDTSVALPIWPGSCVVKKKRQLFPGLVPTSTSSQMLPYNIHVLVKKY
jgi:hypothetical protein